MYAIVLCLVRKNSSSNEAFGGLILFTTITSLLFSQGSASVYSPPSITSTFVYACSNWRRGGRASAKREVHIFSSTDEQQTPQ